MTTELKAQARATYKAAQINRNSTQSINLTTKGVSFGSYSVICATVHACHIDTSKVVGVQDDLVIGRFNGVE